MKIDAMKIDAMTVPSVTNWAWLGRQSPARIARWATEPTEPATWIKHAYAWLHERLDAEQRGQLAEPLTDAAATPRGPLPGMIAVPAALGDGNATLGWVSARFQPTVCTSAGDDAPRAALAAATKVADIFRRLDHGLGWPHVELQVRDAGGHSVGLSAVVATLVNLLSLPTREDFVATGCLNATGELEAVSPESLPAKIRVARQWGYRRILLVEGQTGIPEACPLEVVSIPRELHYAVFEIARAVSIDDPSAAGVSRANLTWARLLAAFDQSTVRSNPRQQDYLGALRVTGTFIANPGSPRLARHIAHDIRSRVYLHQGLTVEATHEKQQADELRPSVMEFPSGWLGDYLRWHQVAHHAILALDQGRWGDNEPEHLQLERTLNRLRDAIDDRRAGREELLAALFLSNTRGRRFDFLGRWHRNAEYLDRAWQDLTCFAEHWEELFAYCREIGLGDSDLKRQQNCCLDILTSRWHLARWAPEHSVPESWLELARTFWPENWSGEIQQLGPFDLPNLLRWRAISGKPPDTRLIDDVLHASRETFERARGGYPFYLVYETIVRYRLGTSAQQREAAWQLGQAYFFSSSGPSDGILSLLGLRAEQLLQAADVRLPDHCRRPSSQRPPIASPVRALVDQLLDQPTTLVDRCPY